MKAEPGGQAAGGGMMGVDDVIRVILAWHFCMVAVFYTAKLLALRHRTGQSHAETSPSQPVQRLTHGMFRIFRMAILLVCVLRVPFPALDGWLGLMPESTALKIAGVVLMTASFGWIVYVHSYLGEFWRSGVAGDGAKVLITDGPYAIMRHPLFAGIALGQVGFALALPSVFSWVCLIVGLAALIAQARYEEQEMARRFAGQWRDYLSRTPALLGVAKRRDLQTG